MYPVTKEDFENEGWRHVQDGQLYYYEKDFNTVKVFLEQFSDKTIHIGTKNQSNYMVTYYMGKCPSVKELRMLQSLIFPEHHNIHGEETWWDR